MINVNYREYLLPNVQYCIYYFFIPFMKMFVHPKLMVFFPTSCHLAYELCFDSYALGEETLNFPYWRTGGVGWGESVFLPL